MHDRPHAHLDPDGSIRVHRPAISRRRAIGAVGAGIAAGAIATLPSPASADQSSPSQPVPLPIPGGIDAGEPVGLIHWFLPGPTDAATPVLGLGGMGLDVDPSTITNFEGFTAFAVLAGEAYGSDHGTYPIEFDVRVMDGIYDDGTGTVREGAYGFF
jgi:hypothetical protein